MARFTVSVVIVFVSAYALGQTGMPWQLLSAMLEWMSAHGYIAMDGPMASLVMASP